MFQPVADGAVLLHTEDEIYFGLNAVGARVWQLLPPNCAELDDLCSTLTAVYPDADPVMVRADVVELLTQLRDNRLVVDPA
ncbi:MAG TPA: PqqD family protein [Gemmatimonadaceae bacterium]|nr:PqqD family protein [Gemmatimonadaceae bacterium]